MRELPIKTTKRYQPLHTITTDIIKILTISSADEDVEQLELSYIVGGNVKWYSYSGKQCHSFL